MAVSTKLRLRNAWFQVHKWIGILLAILIIPISLTGAALVWHDWVDEKANPQRYAVSGEANLAPSAYAASAAGAMQPGERISQIRLPEHHGPVVATILTPAGKGPPERNSIFLNPGDAKVLDRAGANEGVVRLLHILHGSLMVPGVGRQIVGWIGVAMLLSALTGLWLWWPLQGSWTKGLRWRRQNTANANLHHQAGFWISLPLAMLAFTGVWISFPPFFAKISGAPPPPPRPAPALPLDTTRLNPDAVLQTASSAASGKLISISWPTGKSPDWKLSFERDVSPAEVVVNDATGQVTPPKPPKPETLARTMRRLHDGTGMGPFWQTIIFLGGILPALLAVTGIIMWLRTRGWRATTAQRKRSNQAASAAA